MKKMTAFVGAVIVASALVLAGCSHNKKAAAKPMDNKGEMKGGGETGGAYGGGMTGGSYGGGGAMPEGGGGNPCGG